jgi:Co/Zn/Cd efflux system component
MTDILTHEQYLRYRTALTINLAVSFLQCIVLIFAVRSLGLFGDAMHGLADNLLLIGTTIILYFESLGAEKHHGRKRIMARFGGLLLFVSTLGILWEVRERLTDTSPLLSPWWMLVGASVGVVGNFCAHRIISSGDTERDDMLHRANVLHLLGDLALSIAVLAGALMMLFFEFAHVDTWIALLLVSPWLLFRSIQILRHKDPEDEHHHHA